MPNKIVARKEYYLWFNNNFERDYLKVIFIDETSFNLHNTKTIGRSSIGTRAIATVPTIRGKSITLIASISSNRMIYSKIISTSSVNGNIFNQYLQELCSHMRNILFIETACLILDNARIYKLNDVAEIDTEYGYSFKFLSLYSYILNPIENSFSEIKNDIRSRIRMGESVHLCELIQRSISTVIREDCTVILDT
ncbi:hypothetical protein CDIK_3578 [Cucumispora dikerogammari]|nr:hypothetical protein CDIK_3578 [Cucumispora dikerogammari]